MFSLLSVLPRNIIRPPRMRLCSSYFPSVGNFILYFERASVFKSWYHCVLKLLSFPLNFLFFLSLPTEGTIFIFLEAGFRQLSGTSHSVSVHDPHCFEQCLSDLFLQPRWRTGPLQLYPLQCCATPKQNMFSSILFGFFFLRSNVYRKKTNTGILIKIPLVTLTHLVVLRCSHSSSDTFLHYPPAAILYENKTLNLLGKLPRDHLPVELEDLLHRRSGHREALLQLLLRDQTLGVGGDHGPRPALEDEDE